MPRKESPLTIGALSPELLEARHFLRSAALVVPAVALIGGGAGYFWIRSQRSRAPAARRGPKVLLDLLDRIDESASMPQPIGRRGWLGTALAAFFLLALLDLVSFMIVSMYIGGDSLSGDVIDGHYFVSSHGRLTEVTEGTFAFSLWHARSVWLAWALALSGLALNAMRRRRSDPSPRR